MGWLSKLLKKDTKSAVFADNPNGYAPIYTQFGQNIYGSDVVQQAINCIVQEVKKLQPTHVRQNGMDVVPVSGELQRVLNNPNELMTTSEFLEKVTWQLFFNYNSFIIPTYYVRQNGDGTFTRVYTGLYPIQPAQVDFIQDASNRLFVKFRFANSYETTIDYNDVIHVKYKYSVSDYMGGNDSGQPDNAALLQTLQLNHELLQGVARAMKASYAVSGVVKYNTMIDDGKMAANLKELESKVKNSESGFLPMDLKGEFIPLSRDVQLVDDDTLKFIDEKILRNFGVPLAILTGDFTKDQYEAFYSKTIEPLVIAFNQAFTKKLFSDREKSFNNKIVFYTKDLNFMTMEQTLEMIRLLGDSGALYENEKRVSLGMKPLKELEGVRMQSLNYVNVNIAGEYQTGSSHGSDENGGDE